MDLVKAGKRGADRLRGQVRSALKYCTIVAGRLICSQLYILGISIACGANALLASSELEVDVADSKTKRPRSLGRQPCGSGR